eukprot:c2941_g1_i1.p1 GENE.c2941_g1_i1~~c2941_g1_i1.p1  ORF type:complete len:443 (-),score=66.43 c2941_g1_i1:402-1535(-)
MTLSQQAKSLEVTLESKNQQIQRLESQNAQLQSQLDAVDLQATRTSQELQIQLDLRTGELEDLRSRLGQTASDAESFKQQILEMQQQIDSFELIRRRMHNAIQELKGNIRVFCRIRPPLKQHMPGGQLIREIPFKVLPQRTATGQQQIQVSVHPDMGGRKLKHSTGIPGRDRMKEYVFSFDNVFHGATQEKVFEEISQLVQSVLDGYRVCIFAYGQTGSGKTYTMEGEREASKQGVIPRAVQQIFDTTNELREKMGWQFEIDAQFIEIYNDELRDLLRDDPTVSGDSRLQAKHIDGHTSVPGVTVMRVTGSSQVLELLRRANNARVVAETKVHERSSRSHSVFRLDIHGQGSSGESISGILNLIDLAGSERLAVSGL